MLLNTFMSSFIDYRSTRHEHETRQLRWKANNRWLGHNDSYLGHREGSLFTISYHHVRVEVKGGHVGFICQVTGRVELEVIFWGKKKEFFFVKISKIEWWHISKEEIQENQCCCQGSTLAVARWPGATRNWCRATKLSKKLHFGGPIGQLKFQGDDVMRITSYGAEYYRHSLPTVKANTRHLF